MNTNRFYRFLLWACAVMLFVLLATHASPAQADVGIPPWSYPGTSLGSDQPATKVQMVSEEVLVTIEPWNRPEEIAGLYSDAAAHWLGAHVEATFVMRNQGDIVEAFDVWFPAWLPEYPYYGPTAGVEKLAVSVDDALVELTYYEHMDVTTWNGPLPWVSWFVEFPPGEDVIIRVTYDALPSGVRPYGTFYYILETGADWYGSIGAGTITLRLPYEVNETNTALNPESRGLLSDTGPNPANYTISGADVIWQFNDLEPTAEDNIRLTLMLPDAWLEIEAARKDAAANPNSAAAQTHLGNALMAGLQRFKSSYQSQGNSVALAAEARDAFARALELDPQGMEVGDLVTYLILLFWDGEYDISTVPDDLLALLGEAMDLNPQDMEAVVNYLGILYFDWDMRYYKDLPSAPRPSAALMEILDKTIQYDTENPPRWLLEEWSNIGPTATAAPENSPTVPPSPVPTQEPPPADTAQPSPTLPATTPTSNLPRTGLFAIIIGVVLLIAGLLLRRRKQA